MSSKKRCNAKTKEGTPCRRHFRHSGIYCFQHERILSQDDIVTPKRWSAERITPDTKKGDSESTTSTKDLEFQAAVPCVHREVHSSTASSHVSGSDTCIHNDNCRIVRNENLGNITFQSSDNPAIEQSFNSVNNIYNHMGPRTISNCEIYIENFITSFAPVLSNHVEMIETLIKSPSSVGLNKSNNYRLFGDHDITKMDIMLRNLSKLKGKNVFVEKRKMALQEIVQRLTTIAHLLRRASNICQSKRWRDYLRKPGRERTLDPEQGRDPHL